MAKQVGPLFFTGTIDGIIFYKVGDQYYTRSKGSYKSARHMRRNPKYKRTMENADRFGSASKLVQEIYYRHVPKELRKQGLYGQLTGMLNRWLQGGKTREEAQALLIAHCQTLSTPNKQEAISNTQPKGALPSTTNEQRSTTNAYPSKLKQARYLSKWKVKKNGKLHVPIKGSNHLAVKPHRCQAEQILSLSKEAALSVKDRMLSITSIKHSNNHLGHPS